MLPDVLDSKLKVVFCGTAAGNRSASLQQYYVGQGNKFWNTLFQIGLTAKQLNPSEFNTLLSFGIGLTDLVKGKEENEVKEIVNDFLGMIKKNPELRSKNLKEDEKTKLMCLSGVKQYPMRVKCATLSWHTLVSAIDNTQEEINTERVD